MKVDLIKEEIPFDEFFKIYRADLKFEKFDGTMSQKVTRYSFEKPDAVAVLIYHVSKDAYVLVRQFRYPPMHHDVDPWLYEIVAGGKEENEDEEVAAQREVEEETGFRVLKLERICQCYVSPGLMSERVTIFVAEVDDSTQTGNGGGAEGEDEDIELVWISRDNAYQWMNQQHVGDAKTIISLQWHLRQDH
jgi:nudix-type nucleoside diphosphatase (YffH/AdpP family)